MAREAKNYNLAEVQLILGGTPIDGFADGDAIKIEANAELWNYKAGATGAGVRSRNLDDSALVTVTLMQSSPFNDVLDQLNTLDKRTGRGAFSFFCRHGSSQYFGRKAWIEKEPSTTFGKEAGTREWMIRVAHCDFKHGGMPDA